MNRKPKSIQNHYIDSLAINLSSLRSFLKDHFVSQTESEAVINIIADHYYKKTEIILKNCENDWTQLENFSSPLILFIECIDKVVKNKKTMELSSKCLFILQSFLKSLESWMIW